MNKDDTLKTEASLLQFRKQRLAALDVREPYVWRLHLSTAEFERLNKLILSNVAQHNGNCRHLLTTEYALVLIVYLAEWYKRVYQGTMRTDRRALELETHELKQLWEASGISIDTFVYASENGNRLWQYSIYVLGGLGIRHELERNDNGRFLKALCRIYHGEDDTLENLEDARRAIAFCQSIRQKHSLYEYLREILNGTYKDQDNDTLRLLTALKEANDEVLRSKFRFEWVVRYTPASAAMSRRLRVWLKPEGVDGRFHQYLRFDRIHLWGIAHPEKLKWLHFGVRWYQAEKVSCDFDKQKPLISYANTGDENGFVSWGVARYAVCPRVPAKPFTHFCIVAFDNEGKEYLVQREDMAEWMQLWRVEPWKDDWSNIKSSQHQTAVVYNDRCQTDVQPDGRKPFQDKQLGRSAAWSWNYIYHSLTLTDGKGREKVLYHRIGYDQVYARLYKETLHYQEGGLVCVFVEDQEEGEQTELLPVIFDRKDVRICHFDTKESLNVTPATDDTIAEEVAYKTGNGRYIPWTSTQEPPWGIVRLRIMVKGQPHLARMLYLKGPVVRDFEQTAIHYYSLQGKAETYQDCIALDKQPLAPTVPIRVGAAQLDVYRPTKIKEIYLDGAVHAYNLGDHHTTLPYILKRRTRLADFSEQGYRVYDCKELGSIYPLIGKNHNAALCCWDNGIEKPASLLDGNAPEWLNISLGDRSDAEKSGSRFYLWNSYRDEPPRQTLYDVPPILSKADVVFQDMRMPPEPFINVTPRVGLSLSPFELKRIKIKDVELKCFLVAAKYQVYFVAFKPISTVGYHDYDHPHGQMQTIDKLIQPLLEMRNGVLTTSDKENLLRFADEFQLDTAAWNIDLDN